MNIQQLIVAAVSVTAGSYVAKFGDQNYEMLKELGGLPLLLAVIVAALGLMGFGVLSFIWAFKRG